MNAQAQEPGTAVATRQPNPVLANMQASSLDKGMTAIFLPTTLIEAMELAKLMAASNFMPKHLRDKPGDCLAVVIQASNWGMNAYAVGNKSYFVNDRMAYEAQLVNAVVITSKALEGRLSISWEGEGDHLVCRVRGKIKGDPEVKEVWQEIRHIKTKNSPLWASSPRQQLAYYTTRMWARLHTPEVLMGVYTPDELELHAEDLENPQSDGSTVHPPRPVRLKPGPYPESRSEPEAEVSTGEVAADAEQVDTSNAPATDPAEDAGADAADDQGDEQQPAKTMTYAELATEIIDAIRAVTNDTGLREVMTKYDAEADELRHDAPEEFKRVETEVRMKRAALRR